jgi:hypothetical protein
LQKAACYISAVNGMVLLCLCVGLHLKVSS